MEITDKVIIVTGASSGIGEATARLLTEKGAKVVLVARSTEKIMKLSEGLPRSIAITADMSKEAEIEKMIETVRKHFGRIDILINNAGQGYGSPVEKIDLKKIRYIFDLNVIGPLAAMQAVIPIMREQGGGLIVNISSGTSLMYLPNVAAYSASKRAFNGISLTARAELEKDNIKVSVLYPYITATDFYRNAISVGAGSKGHVQTSANMPPPDTSEFVADKIIELINSEESELTAHDWMKKR